MTKKKKYNQYTKGYKIDLFATNKGSNIYMYLCSTDMFRRCKDAVDNYISKNINFCKDKNIIGRFDYGR